MAGRRKLLPAWKVIEVYKRNGNICRICGYPMIFNLDLNDHSIFDPSEIDHIIPLSKGGSDDVENLGVAHRSCNRKKNNRIGFTCEYKWAEECELRGAKRQKGGYGGRR